ncbi:mechanosensitive ion channel family protein [Croceicoccus sp. Ery15]|uniref:mechanosensitive ion channel family protein n=1 Tax=Croceicoccus sp. Ery15 TaxID=1703338 RepID=UPI001E3C847D|nr:mechanosensitive ion channel domain-containing protein [Croceicoccus sp. Ery15]
MPNAPQNCRNRHLLAELRIALFVIAALLATAMLVGGPARAAAPAAGTALVTKDETQKALATAEAMFAGFDDNAARARALLLTPADDFSSDETAKLNEVRRQLAADRDKANGFAEQGTTASRVLKAQIAALGPEPADGENEPEAVTERRKQLETELGKVLAPTFRLSEAGARASVLVTELDERASSLRKQRLTQRGFSPLDPRLWMRSVRELGNAVGIARAHMATSFAKYDAGEVTGAFALAVGLLLFGPVAGYVIWRRLGRRLTAWHLQENSIARRLLVAVAADATIGLIFAIALLAGVFALMIFLLPVVPVETLAGLVAAVVSASLFVAVAHWIGRGILNSPFPELRLVTLPPARAKKALRAIKLMAGVLGVEQVIGSLEEAGQIGPNFARLASAIMVGFGAWLLWRLANYLREGRRFYEEQQRAEPHGPSPDHGIDFSTPMARLLKLFAMVSIAAVLVGYELLSRFFFSASLLSLSIIGIAVYLHRSFVLVISAFATGSLSRYRRGLHLLPLLTGLIETIVVIMLLAVVWGYDANEIGDGLIMLREGVSFGDVRLSLGDVATFAAVFFIGYFVTRWLQRFLKVSIMPEFAMEAGAEAAILTFIGYIGIFLAALIAVATTGLDLSSLAFVAGALSVGLGFGLQSVVENFTSGILLLIERPIKQGDWIEVGEYSGIVRKIAVRSTHIETFDRHQIIVPNSQLISGVVVNRSFSTGPARIVVPVGVAYGTDLERVRKILLEIANANDDVLADPEPAVAMVGFGESSIDVKILAFVHQATDGAPTASAINFEIARRFAEEGIEIPFPQRDLHIRTAPPALDGSAKPA